jgi:transposase
MLTLPYPVRIFLYVPPVDMRCGMAKLSMVAEHYLQQDPYSGHFFVYFNKRGDKCKILYWDRTGFCLWYKRLERGTFERLAVADGCFRREMDFTTLSLILEGIDLSNIKHRKRYRRA